MKKNQESMVNGIQNILIPMETFYVTQGNNEGTHRGANAIDLAGNDTGRDYAFFPFDAACKAVDSVNGNAVWWESLSPVRFADGTIDFCTLMVIHDNDLSGIYIGALYKQGQQMAQEGTAGIATGNHLHFEFAKGKFIKQYSKNQYGVYHLPNSIPIEHVCFADGTVFRNGGNLAWHYTSKLSSEEISVSSPKELYLPPEATNWFVYPLNKAPVIGNQSGSLNPSLFGGLIYPIIDMPQSDVVTIQTRDFGIVNIYVGTETKAIIR